MLTCVSVLYVMYSENKLPDHPNYMVARVYRHGYVYACLEDVIRNTEKTERTIK